MKYRYSYETAIGRLTIVADETTIIRISLNEVDNTDSALQETSLIARTYKEIEEYLRGERKEFDIPITLSGTPFQLQVWKELQNIPYGETCSYTEIAERVGHKGSCRAIGNANRHNPILLLVPCHRVIAQDGSLAGYAGGSHVKRKLLKMEKEKAHML
ncbi:MAG: methylated-DNA--[protein]-cysteine S-methyltransferase [Bacteroidaceae bacterium]|jgi:O-6-methylguanine DNA methyltransferase